MGMEQAWLIPAMPAATAAILILFGKYLPRKGDWLSVLAIGASFVLFIFVLKDLTTRAGAAAASSRRSTPAASGCKFGSFELRIGFQVDQLAAVMVAVVSFISLMVQVYSLGYMKGDKRYGWYFAVQSLFAAAMLTLVLADNFLLLYFAWEGVGLCSFLLIGHYHERRSAAEAAKKAFITTRLGDVGLLIGIILLYRSVGTFDMSTIFNAARAGQIDHAYLTAAVLLILLGAMGKSAQFPFHVWLPDAMEGPTPVSALIHAATMVVAGVYLVARTMPLFQAVDGHARRRHRRRPDHGVHVGDDGPGDDGHQARRRLLDAEQPGAHVHRAGRRLGDGGAALLVHARLLQGAALPRLRLRLPRDGRAGDDADGRPGEEDAGDGDGLHAGRACRWRACSRSPASGTRTSCC